jgi:diadenosine tetraphosphate (Ap4A) HIT family hydrolase
MNDARYPWLVLVPRIHGARELHDLDGKDGARLWADIMSTSKAIGDWPGVDKVNVGALGNIVPQLHVHIIGRCAADTAWPGPVWGHSPPTRYMGGKERALIDYLQSVLAVPR